MEFARPWFLILLPLVALPFVWRRRSAVRFSSFLVLPTDPLSRALELAERWLAVVFIGAIIVSLSGPQTGERAVFRWMRGARLIFVLDQSASMFSPWSGAPVQEVRKITVAREAIGQFVNQRGTDQLGLIGFGKSAILYTPPTFDHRRFLRTVGLLNTDLGDTLIDIALLRALELLDSSGEESGGQAVILLSDGVGRVQLPEEIGRRFRNAEVPLYWLVIEGGESQDERMERLMEMAGPQARTFAVGQINELPRALEAVGRLEERVIRVEQQIEEKTWSRLFRAIALGSLLALGVFVLGERAVRIGGGDR